MQYRIIRHCDCQTGHWSGGSTTELFLWPESASYAGRDFSVRVSTATVDIDTSDFTPLPGYTRLLMTLKGEMRLEIEGREEVALPPWQIVRFDGGDRTRSLGRCVDFGVMLGAGWDGSLYSTGPGEILCAADGFTGLYAPVSPAEIAVHAAGSQDQTTHLDPGDLLLINEGERVTVQSADTVAVFTALQLGCQPDHLSGLPEE